MMDHVEPEGELAVRLMAMPRDANINGDIFGGWVLSQMDIAGVSIAFKRTKCRMTTVAVDSMSFIAPIHVGDFVCCYGDIIKQGRTSMHVRVSTWAEAPEGTERRHVTEGVFVYVAIDKAGRPILIDS